MIDNSKLIQKAMGGTPTAEMIETTARRWQSEGMSTWLGLEQGNRRMTAAVATGAGKTRFAIMVTLNHLHEYGDDGVVVFAVPTKGLVQQVSENLRGFSISYARVSSQYGNEYMLKRKVYVTTYLSLNKVKNSKHVKGKNVLLICDECHKAGASGTQAKLADFKGDSCLLLSATPERGDGHSVMQIMNAPILYTLDLISGIQQSRQGDDELDYTLHHVTIQMTNEERFQLIELDRVCRILKNVAKTALSDAGLNASDAALMHYSNAHFNEVAIYKAKTMERKRYENEISGRFDAIIALAVKDIGKKYAIFHDSILGIERIAQMLRDVGINPHIYHSGMELSQEEAQQYPELNTPALRKRLKDYAKNANKHLTRWKESASDYLLTCKSLKEGFDAPDMDGVVMVSGTNSTRGRIQTIGRVFRGAKHKDIYFFVLPAVTDRTSGDERCFYDVVQKTGIESDKIKYTSSSMLHNSVASVSYGDSNEYLAFHTSNTEEEEEEPMFFDFSGLNDEESE